MSLIFTPRYCNPAPSSVRLPGDRTPSRMRLPEVTGSTRRMISHALTFYGYPSDIDKKLSAVPTENDLLKLGWTGSKYFSMSLYSLKQMLTTGAINPDLAWDLFTEDLPRAFDLKGNDPTSPRASFWQSVEKGIRSEAGDDAFNRSICIYCLDDTGAFDPLRFEVLVRGGHEALKKQQYFHSWAKFASINGSTPGQPDPKDIDEKKLIWTFTAMTQAWSGIKAIVRPRVPNQRFWTNTSRDTFAGYETEIDLNVLRRNADGPVDSGIASEFGHFIMEPFDLKRDRDGDSWQEELADRINYSGFSDHVNIDHSVMREEVIPPVYKAFSGGGFYLSACGHDFPQYPCEAPALPHRQREAHISAECVEAQLRKRLMEALRAKEIGPENLHYHYRIAQFVFGLYPDADLTPDRAISLLWEHPVRSLLSDEAVARGLKARHGHDIHIMNNIVSERMRALTLQMKG